MSNFVKRILSPIKGVHYLVSKGASVSDALYFSYNLVKARATHIFDYPKITDTLYNDYTEMKDFQSIIKYYQNRAEERIFDPQKRSHISLTDSKDSNMEDRGMLFTTDQHGKNIRLATEEEIMDANLFALGGIDFDNRKYLSSLMKYLYILQSYTLNPHPLWYFKPLAIHPYVSKAERYEAAVKFSLDKKYYPEYAKTFVENIIMPRMIDPQNGLIVPPEREITFFSYSVGGRDIFMFENAIRDILIKRGADKEKIHQVFEKFRGVSVAYAVDIDGLGDQVGFLKVILFYSSDYGVLIPRATKLLIKSRKLINEPSVFKIIGEENLSHPQYFCLLSYTDGLFPEEEDMYSCHGLSSYIKAISKSKTLRELFCLPLHATLGEGEDTTESTGDVVDIFPDGFY